ncbi:MAG: PEP-CTERM sorting domain-containing protein [Candidatus Thermoplasmatota archaeon]|nr:PEP-CTERM sorting domain-containing protein [Candidatus Thermoplasmatota archaeon]
MKLKLIALAAMLAAGSANATIQDGSAGNGELFMTVLDSVGLKSYTLDLNLTMNDFLAGIAVSGKSYNYTADANMASFLSMVAPADKSGLVFAIGAMDTVGATATDYHRYISTASAIDLNNTVTNANLKQLGSSGATFLGNTNGLIGNADSLIVTDSSLVAYAGSAQWGSNWGTSANFTSTGLTDTDEIVEATDLGMYFLRQAPGGAFADRLKPSSYAAILQDGNQVYANLSTNGNLMIAAVPEAETYAMMLAGLGLVGFMVARRRQA